MALEGIILCCLQLEEMHKKRYNRKVANSIWDS